MVNGRELHHKDLELLKKRGLPGTPGKSYNVDIDGRLTEAETGVELKGLGRLAPTYEPSVFLVSLKVKFVTTYISCRLFLEVLQYSLQCLALTVIFRFQVGADR